MIKSVTEEELKKSKSEEDINKESKDINQINMRGTRFSRADKYGTMINKYQKKHRISFGDQFDGDQNKLIHIKTFEKNKEAIQSSKSVVSYDKNKFVCNLCQYCSIF